MSNSSTQIAIKKLNAILAKANDDYYNNQPTLTDSEYDSLRARLVKLESENKELALENSVTQSVGAPVPANAKTSKHSVKLLSLDNVYTHEGVDKFINRVLKANPGVAVYVESKYDGVAIRISYRKGIFIEAAQRGDGIEGEVIINASSIIKGIPLHLSAGQLADIDIIDICGEVVISKTDLAAINKARQSAGLPAFKNGRSYVSGYLRRKEVDVTHRPEVIIHGANIPEGDIYSSYLDISQDLAKSGIITAQSLLVDGNVVDILELFSEAIPQAKNYETDGAVFKLYDLRARELLGTTNRVPKWAIAYKFPAKEAVTTLTAIEYQVGRTGVITPVGIFDPVVIGGVTITNANLCNKDEMNRLGIGVGDTITVTRQAEVIPKIIRVLESANNPEVFPTHCPSCGNELLVDEGVVAVKCINPKCKAILTERLVHFTSRSGMWIAGLGRTILKEAVDKGLIKDDLFTIYEMSFLADLIIKLGLSIKVVGKIAREIEHSKKRPLENFIIALGIPGVGPKVATVIATEFLPTETIHCHYYAKHFKALANRIKRCVTRMGIKNS